jgi:hypothetical protein
MYAIYIVYMNTDDGLWTYGLWTTLVDSMQLISVALQLRQRVMSEFEGHFLQ